MLYFSALRVSVRPVDLRAGEICEITDKYFSSNNSKNSKNSKRRFQLLNCEEFIPFSDSHDCKLNFFGELVRDNEAYCKKTSLGAL